MESPSSFRSLLARLAPLCPAILVFALAACGGESAQPANLTPSSGAQISLTSQAFDAGGSIPRDFTCDGANQSPPLSWTDPPTSTRSLALIVDDPDAPGGTFVHWVLYGLPTGSRSLSPALSTAAQLPDGSRQGTNGFGKVGYGGPCPPGGTHHYRFHLYALDTSPDLAAGASADSLRSAMSGHVLASGELVGTYSRQR